MSSGTDVLPPRYDNCERIGRGGMGDIYLAHDRQLSRKVAIKVLADRFASDPDVRERFKREALTAARLSGHPHIVAIFDVGEWNDTPHIVMEYLAGGTVADRVRAGTVPLGDALDWLDQAANALDEAHRAGIVHRDVKPANLLFDSRDELNVADFGIARVLDQTTVGMTSPGTILGTSGYLSPEQASGEHATAASDLYSLGVVAFELLTGARPFQRRSATAEAAAHIHEPVPLATERRPELVTEVDDVFERALAKDPARRQGTAGELVADLRAAVEAGEQHTRAIPLPGAPTQTIAQSAPPPRRRGGWLFPVLVGLLLLGGGAGAAALLAGGGDKKRAVVTKTVQSVRTRRVTAQGTTITQPTTVSQTITATASPPAPPPPVTPSATTTGTSTTTPPPPTGSTPSANDAIRLTDQAKNANNAGDYATALSLGLRAVQGLSGSGALYEAYADYNYAVSLLHTGQCAQAVSYFNSSEQIQGRRAEIDRDRKLAQKCAGGKSGGKGQGKVKPAGAE